MRPEELRNRLERGEPIVVLDIRPAPERAEWTIPGSRWVDAYQAVKSGDFRPLDALNLPQGVPVVVVCAAGATSVLAADYLRSRGVPADSLEGGMRGWSLSWNRAELELPEGIRLIQVRRVGKGCLSYLVAAGSEALVIDPALEPAVFREIAEELGVRIAGILDTHVHADHVSRAQRLSTQLGVPFFLPGNDRVRYPYEPVVDGDRIPVGESWLEVWHTPGHTWESACYLLAGRALFTGDTLFVEGIGRPDLKTKGEEARARARALFRSLRRLLTLPASTLVLPGHTSEPPAFDGRPIVASLGELAERLPFLRCDESTFVDGVLAHLPPPPPNYQRIAELNAAGSWLDELEALLELEAGPNRCAVR